MKSENPDGKGMKMPGILIERTRMPVLTEGKNMMIPESIGKKRKD